MQTTSEALTTNPRALKAANEDFTGTAAEVRKAEHQPASGWDPYEVWRTRVKTVEDSPGRLTHR